MKVAAYFLSIIGLILEIRGVYLASLIFQPIKFSSFCKHSIRLSLICLLEFKPDVVFTKGLSLLAEVRKNLIDLQRSEAAYSFAGLSLIFMGFLFQLASVIIFALQG